jgi:outer membrane lipoprotein SlyB
MNICIKMAIAGLIAASAIISGCASPSSGSVYSSGQTRQEQTVRMGVV